MPKEKVETNKDKLLSDVLNEIEREYGKGSVMKLGDRAAVDIEPIPSGSLLLDDALGIGGYPKGRIIEIFGPESSGKTTLALHAVAEVQKKGGRAAFIDAENAIDPVYAKNLGVNIDELILSQPDSGEQGLDIMLMLVESGAVDLVVVDSVAALVPQAELDGEMGDNQVGLQARMMSKAMRKLAGAMNQNDCTAIFINQLREKVGVIYGNPETTPGGRALKFYSSVRVDIRKADGELAYKYGVILNYLFNIEDLEKNMNNNLSVHVVKKKIAHIDENGNAVKPETENGFKFETLVLDMVHMMDNCLAYEVVREKEFAPIKNKTGVDSVESARELLKLNGVTL